MTYRNLHLTPQDQEFKTKYKSVIDAHAKLEAHGEVEVTFTTHNGLLVWRRRCYEYQKITGKTFRVEVAYGYTLLLRPRRRRPIGDYGIVSIGARTPNGVEEAPLPDAEGVVVTDADMELARKVLARMAEKKMQKKDPLLAAMDEEFGGSHGDTGGADSGGDAAGAGSSGGSDED